MFCKKCGKEIDDNSTFCQFCGEDLNVVKNNLLSSVKNFLCCHKNFKISAIMTNKSISTISLLFLILLLSTFGFFLLFKNSYYYTEYQISLASKYGDNVRAMEYVDTDKVADGISASLLIYFAEKLTPDEYLALSSIVSDMKPIFKNQVEQSISRIWGESSDNYKGKNNIKILYNTLHNQTFDNRKIKYSKISKYKVKRTLCDDDNCNSIIFEKVNGKWEITMIILPSNFFDEFLEEF